MAAAEKEDDPSGRSADRAARDYQLDLLEKAKEDNVIVYLGTGSGKTFIAIMLIKHMRGELGRLENGKYLDGKKVVFLSPSVALVDQQEKEIRNCTGLSVKSYTGADGVDDWSVKKWEEEVESHQVFCMVHDVFKLALSCRGINFSQLCLLIMDECHHAGAGNSSYSVIMDLYHEHKYISDQIPKILGLTACIVMKNVPVEKFRKEKLMLEKKMDARVVTAEDYNLYDLLKYVTSPDEFEINFDLTYQTVQAMTEIFDIISTTEDRLLNANSTELKRIKETYPNPCNNGTLAKKDLEKDFKRVKNDCLLSLKTNIMNIGLCSVMDIHAEIEKLTQCKNRVGNYYYEESVRSILYSETIACLESIQRKFAELERNNSQLSDLERLQKYLSSKFHQLLEYLIKENTELNAASNDGEMTRERFKQLHCIIFVEERSVCQRMANVFEALSRLDPRFEGLKVDYVFSPTSGFYFNRATGKVTVSEESKQDRRRVQRVIQDFKDDKINVLISTSVVEEGLDVRKCNLVIKYDFPKTFRSYVQSKGRARQKPSKYVMFLDVAGNDKKKLQEYREVEELSMKECHYYENPDEIEDDRDEVPMFFADPEHPETSAFINGIEAISLISKYVAKIPVDRFTRLTPVWHLRKVVDDGPQNMLLRGLGLGQDEADYICDLYLPHKTPFRNKIEGAAKSTKEQAKRDCAITAIKKLFEVGELDHRLKIRTVKKNVEESEEDSEEDDIEVNKRRGRKIGTRRRHQFYKYEEPWPLCVKPSLQSAFLYKVDMVLCGPNENARYKHFHPETYQHSLGLVLGAQAPNFGPLRLYGPSGELDVNVKFIHGLNVDQDFFTKAQEFHEFAFSQVLGIEYMEYNFQSMVLVPLKNDQVDLSVLQDRSHLPISLDSVIVPKYNSAQLYFVEDILTDMSPRDTMNEYPVSYIQHFKDRYKITIQDEDQPLLRISNADKKKFMFKCGDELRKDGTSDDISKRRLLVPELMKQKPLAAGLWKQIQIVPFVIQRMRTLLFSYKLSQQLTKITQNPSVPYSLSGADTIRNKDTGLSLVQLFKFDPPGVNQANLNLAEALTLKNCSDMFDLERMEVLGDVFLKYIVGTFLFHSYLCFKEQGGETRNYTEGDMALARSKIVGNKNLYKIAVEELGLHAGGLNAALINTHTTFCPPGATSTKEIWLIEMDEKFPSLIEDNKKRGKLAVGSLLHYLNKKDLPNPTEEVLKAARERFLAADNDEKIHGISTREYRVISDKSLSDSVEAIIGTFLYHSGQKNTLQMMSGIGLNCSCPGPSAKDYENALENLNERRPNFMAQPMNFPETQNALVNDRITEGDLKELYARLGVQEIEDKIGYTFNEKSFLLQAFTHSSYTENFATDSYELIEFLGDGILDYIVTCYIFKQNQELAPGKLTDIRSALVCNNMFAGLLVDKGLHGNILYSAPAIRAKIMEYVDSRTRSTAYSQRVEMSNREMGDGAALCGKAQVDKEGLKLINESEPLELTDVEVPKILGDVFEALIGAVYLDCKLDLNTVWQVYQKFNPGIDEIMKDPPRSPKKIVHEIFQDVEFGKLEMRDDKVKIVMTLKHNGKPGKFAGLGNNRRQAEIAACKCALKFYNKRTY